MSTSVPKGDLTAAATATRSSATSPLNASISAWKGKIKVVDPDAPPTFQHALESWLSTANTRNGFDGARYKFVTTHFQDVKNVLEVVLRLIRGIAPSPSSSLSSAERSHSTAHSHSHHSAGSSHHLTHHHHQSASLAAQASAAEAPYPEQQTAVSLATFQLLRLGLEAAVEAGVKRSEIERKVGEIVRTLPYSLIFRALDSMFVDFKAKLRKGESGSAARSGGNAGRSGSGSSSNSASAPAPFASVTSAPEKDEA